MLEARFLIGMRIFITSCVHVTSVLMAVACEAYFTRAQESESILVTSICRHSHWEKRH